MVVLIKMLRNADVNVICFERIIFQPIDDVASTVAIIKTQNFLFVFSLSVNYDDYGIYFSSLCKLNYNLLNEKFKIRKHSVTS